MTKLTKRTKIDGGTIELQKWVLFGSNDQTKELRALKERERLLELHTKHALEKAVSSMHQTDSRTANKMAEISKRTNAFLEHLATIESDLNTMTKRDAHLQVRVMVEGLKIHYEDLRAQNQLLYHVKDLLTDKELSKKLYSIKGKMTGNIMLSTTNLPDLRKILLVEVLKNAEPLVMIIHVSAVYKEVF